MRLILLLFILLIVSCRGLENWGIHQQRLIVAESETLPAPLSDEDFVVNSVKIFIELGMDYRDLKTDERITVASHANERRAYDYLVYENFIISVGIDIFMIALTTPVFETSRGVKTGDSISSVLEKYGLPNKVEKLSRVGGIAENEYYYYTTNQKAILFYVDESGMITRIQYVFDHA